MDKEKMISPPSRAREEATKEISRGRELVAQLRALLASWFAEKGWSEPAGDMFEAALRCLSAALSILQSTERLESCHQKAGDRCGSLKKKKGGTKSNTGHKRWRHEESWSTVTTVPLFDGYEWRKYGTKPISNSQFQRHYYKCGFKGCEARKTVEQKNDADPAEYIVTYGKQHTCNLYKRNNKMNSSEITNAPNPIIESNSFNSKQYINEEEESVSQVAVDAEPPSWSEPTPWLISPPSPMGEAELLEILMQM